MPSESPLHSNSSWLSLRVPPLALFVLFAVAIWLFPDTVLVSIPGAWIFAALLATMGGAFCIAGVLAFWKAKTTVNPVTPAESTALVIHGVYRLTRNPMYLGFALLLLAFALWLDSLIGVLFVPQFMAYLQHFQIRPEEEALHVRFGTAFDIYRQHVRRWL